MPSKNHTMRRRTALKGIAASGVSGLVLSGNVIAKPGKGKSKGKCDVVVPDDESTIQAAVDSAGSGDTVCVKDGTYAEQVLINKSLTLQTASGASPTIEAVNAADSFTIAESGPSWEPMVFAFGGTESGGAVSGAGTVDVDLSGFTLDGLEKQPEARRKPAVLYRNASGTVSDNTVENMGIGGKETFGILAYGDSDVTVAGNDVSDYERGGIGANGDGGAHPSPSVEIRNNTVIGSTGIGEAWGPNGIQVGFGATGRVKNNNVADNRYSDEAPVASGILIFESDAIEVANNTVTNADIALSCGSWGWFNASANNCKFMKNEVDSAEYGCLLEAVAEPYDGVLTQTDPAVNNNKVINNVLEGEDDPNGNIGVGVVVEDNIDNENDPSAENNKIIRNTITRFETPVKNEGSGTKIRPVEP